MEDFGSDGDAHAGRSDITHDIARQIHVKTAHRTYTIKGVKTGYATATIRRSISSTMTLNVQLVPTKPSGATARCKDRTWPKSQNRSGTCSSHKGEAYWVCPGKL